MKVAQSFKRFRRKEGRGQREVFFFARKLYFCREGERKSVCVCVRERVPKGSRRERTGEGGGV